LVDVRAAQHRVLVDARRKGDRPRDACARALRGLHDLARRLVEQAVIVGLEANPNLVGLSHGLLPYSKILVATPAPTVRPPSRIAKRCFSSSATAVMRSTVIFTLSPGITILTSSGSAMVPVTSVVRM